jgi:hypothetical protein
METAADAPAIHFSRKYRLLRPVFIAGLAVSLILYLVPCYKPAGDILTAWTSTGGVERRLSSFDLCCLLVRTGNVQWGTFYIALSSVELALLVLALQRPRRWVFLAGSCEQLYLLVAFLLRPTSNDLSQPWFWDLLEYAAWAMCLTGFFVKPSSPSVAARSVVAPTHSHGQPLA